jgi:glycosyltransferase involved in cell wall biosynthesis
MKIVIAAWHLRDFNVGIGRYCRGLIAALGRVDRVNDYEVLFPETTWQFSEWPNVRYRQIKLPVFKRRLWEQVVPQLVGRYDVLHFPHDSVVSWKRGKFVASIHDVKPLIFETLRPRRGWNSLVEHLFIPDRQTQLDHVLTLSDCSRRDIIERLQMPAQRVSVVYPGVDLDQFCPGSVECEQPTRPYILCVAGSDPTKNVETLLKAFAQLPSHLRTEHDVILVGDLRRRLDLHDHVRQLGIEANVRFAGMVDDAQLVRHYQQAVVLVFPSRYEGFGLPVVEAMACGCPVISSDASSLPEATGDAALLANPSDIDGFAKHLEQVLSDRAIRQRLREKGLARAAQFTWDRTARETVRVYRQVMES